ncbi:MAG: hypothetical protein QF922_08455, partial [SAR324 cluster bacterium]|nr:hypothetical protein [SAR324 cluster bacterium]
MAEYQGDRPEDSADRVVEPVGFLPEADEPEHPAIQDQARGGEDRCGQDVDSYPDGDGTEE